MVTSVWGRIKQAYINSNRATGKGEGLYNVTYVVSNARMKTLRADPLVAIKGIPGRTLIPISILSSTPEVTTVRSGDVDIRLEYKKGSSYINITSDIDRTTMQGDASSGRLTFVAILTPSRDGDLIGSDLVLRNVDGAEYGAGSIDNITTFNIVYYIL